MIQSKTYMQNTQINSRLVAAKNLKVRKILLNNIFSSDAWPYGYTWLPETECYG